MNVSDSNTLQELLIDRGGTPADEPSMADLLIVNTCSVREKAERTAKNKIKEYGSIKKKNAALWVVGCMSQRVGESLRREIPSVTAVIGAMDMEYIHTQIDTLLETVESANTVSGKGRSYGECSAFIPVMRGCNNYCSYCIVPYVRGDEHSLSVEEILNDIQKKVARGVREITLLGQNVNSYGTEKTTFAELLRRVNDVPGIDRIRFTTSHPKDISDELISAVASLSKVAKHIHLPVQSGADAVLKRMNRKYTRAMYLETIDKIRRACSPIDITTDVMVGFPGESESDFADTLSLFSDVGYTTAFMFAYSPRTGTPAVDFPEQVPEKVKKERLQELISLQTEITKGKYAAMKGKTVEALITYKSSRGWIGQDMGAKRVFIQSTDDLYGKMIRGTVSETTGMTLVISEYTRIS